MTAIRKPAPAQDRPSHNHTYTNDSNPKCSVRGCVWRGVCPVHSEKHPRGFDSTSAMMRIRHQGGDL